MNKAGELGTATQKDSPSDAGQATGLNKARQEGTATQKDSPSDAGQVTGQWLAMNALNLQLVSPPAPHVPPVRQRTPKDAAKQEAREAKGKHDFKAWCQASLMNIKTNELVKVMKEQ